MISQLYDKTLYTTIQRLDRGRERRKLFRDFTLVNVVLKNFQDLFIFFAFIQLLPHGVYTRALALSSFTLLSQIEGELPPNTKTMFSELYIDPIDYHFKYSLDIPLLHRETDLARPPRRDCDKSLCERPRYRICSICSQYLPFKYSSLIQRAYYHMTFSTSN